MPKEPSLNPKDRRLAVQVEDHPLDYGSFEGEIPEGEYGAGSVVIWDQGHWTPLVDTDEGLKDGKLDFTLDGRRLKGRFTLVRMAERGKRKPGKENWLLLKRHDKPPHAAQGRRAARPQKASDAAGPERPARRAARRSAREAVAAARDTGNAAARRRRLVVRAEARRLSRALPRRERPGQSANAPRQRLD